MKKFKFNKKQCIEHITKSLKDRNTGSYEADGYGENYFDDALNIDEVLDNALNIINKYFGEYQENSLSQEDMDKFSKEINNISVEFNLNRLWNYAQI